jgi:hypothetical protein
MQWWIIVLICFGPLLHARGGGLTDFDVFLGLSMAIAGFSTVAFLILKPVVVETTQECARIWGAFWREFRVRWTGSAPPSRDWLRSQSPRTPGSSCPRTRS